MANLTRYIKTRTEAVLASQPNKNTGFTLVEMAIVVIIAGIIFAMLFTLLDKYFQEKRIQGTEASIQTAHEAIVRFFNEYGHLPCPAPLYQNATYQSGEDTRCTGWNRDGTAREPEVDIGECGHGYCVAQGAMDLDGDGTFETTEWDFDNNPDTDPTPIRVRIGSVPFRILSRGLGADVDENGNIITSDPLREFVISYTDRVEGEVAERASEADPTILVPIEYEAFTDNFIFGLENAIDGYDRRLVYAVTEQQATTQYQDGVSGIAIVNEHGAFTDDLVEYVLISPGSNRSASFSLESNESDLNAAQTQHALCAGLASTNTGTITVDDATETYNFDESENCDMDFVFLDSLDYSADDNYFDDRVSFQSFFLPYQWDYTPRTRITEEFTEVYALNKGNVLAGLMRQESHLDEDGNVIPGALDYTNDKLHIRGGDFMMQNQIHGRLFCDMKGTNCFWPDLIGAPENNPRGFAGDGNSPSDPEKGCEPGLRSAMTGIAYNTRNCAYFLQSGGGVCGRGRTLGALMPGLLGAPGTTNPNTPSQRFIKSFTHDMGTGLVEITCADRGG